jgi:hypothetical protein
LSIQKRKYIYVDDIINMPNSVAIASYSHSRKKVVKHQFFMEDFFEKFEA